MELERKPTYKAGSINPLDIKEINFNNLNLYGANLKSKKNNNNNFKLAIKLKRNFK